MQFVFFYRNSVKEDGALDSCFDKISILRFPYLHAVTEFGKQKYLRDL